MSDEFETFHIPGQVQPSMKPEDSPFSGSTVFDTPQEVTTYTKDEVEKPTNDANQAPPSVMLNTSLASGGPSRDELLFFNYNEYSVKRYESLSNRAYKKHTYPLIITHFPNPYVDPLSKEYRSTRIVRVPRVYDSVKGLRYPQFSRVMPGFESAALIDPSEPTKDLSKISKFVPRGLYKNHVFGYLSVSPLSNHLEVSHFQDIVDRVNEYLRQAYDPLSAGNIVYGTLNFLSIWLLDEVVRNRSKRILAELQSYIEELNNGLLKQRRLRLISPQASGFVSVSITVLACLLFFSLTSA